MLSITLGSCICTALSHPAGYSRWAYLGREVRALTPSPGAKIESNERERGRQGAGRKRAPPWACLHQEEIMPGRYLSYKEIDSGYKKKKKKKLRFALQQKL